MINQYAQIYDELLVIKSKQGDKYRSGLGKRRVGCEYAFQVRYWGFFQIIYPL